MKMKTEIKILEQLEYFKVLEEIRKYCSTDLAKQYVSEIRPLKELGMIQKEGAYVSEAKNILIEKDSPPFEFIPDLRETLIRTTIDGAILSIEQIRQILKISQVSRKVYQYLSSVDNTGAIFDDFAGKLFVDKVFEFQIANIFTESGELKDNASDKLRDIRRQIIDKSDQLRKAVNKILRRLSESFLVQDEYVTLRDGRIVVPIKAEHKRHVRGFIHSESSTGQTVYIEPEETLDLNNEILSLTFAEKREIERILKSITRKIGEEYIQLSNSLSSIAKIDSIFAKARYSVEIIGSFPTIDKSLRFELIDARHPILLRRMGRENTVPLSLKMNNENVILITGPNAGGKTVVLKTIGLLSLLVQSGLHIPADPDSNFRLFDAVLMDIGDQQSIEDDLSTFSSHLSNINDILCKANNNSLILLDEIGTGTDPAEGSALATAILIQLQKLGSLVFATTHHGNLKILANELNGFINSSMLFDSHELKPTYKFSLGMPGSSYAFEVAKRIGLNEVILDSARDYLDTNKTKVEEFLLDLEKKSNDLKEKVNFYEIENVRLTGLMNLYSEKINKLEKEKRDILRKMKEDAQIYLKDVNKKVESAIKNIRESQADKTIVKEEKRNIEKIREKTESLFREPVKSDPIQNVEIKLGDIVRIKDTETVGELIEIDNDKGVILSGNIKVRSKLSRLEFYSKKKKTETQTSLYNVTSGIDSFRLDIRGKKPEEAEFEVIKYIDEAYSSDVKNVEILHGKGTGVLKNLVKEILSKHEAVKDFQYAKIEFGGEGITVVELK